MPLAVGLVGEMSVSLNREVHSGTCVSAVKELLVFFIKKSPVENLLSRIQDLAIPAGGSR